MCGCRLYSTGCLHPRLEQSVKVYSQYQWPIEQKIAYEHAKMKVCVPKPFLFPWKTMYSVLKVKISYIFSFGIHIIYVFLAICPNSHALSVMLAWSFLFACVHVIHFFSLFSVHIFKQNVIFVCFPNDVNDQQKLHFSCGFICLLTENQPFPRDEWNLPQGSSGQKLESHDEDVPQGVQHLPQDLVSPCRVSSLPSHHLSRKFRRACISYLSPTFFLPCRKSAPQWDQTTDLFLTEKNLFCQHVFCWGWMAVYKMT